MQGRSATSRSAPGSCVGPGFSFGDFYNAPNNAILFDITPAQGLLTGLERKQVNLSSHYDVFPGVTATLEAFYTDRQSATQLNPEPIGPDITTPQFTSGLFIAPTYVNSAGVTVVNPNNPTNNPAFVAASGATPGQPVPLITRRFENGPRGYTDDISTYRIRVGLDGTIFDNYTWDVGYSYGQSTATYRVSGEVNYFHMSQELGMNPCGTAVGCSIGNFLGFNTLTPAQAAYLIYDNTDTSQYALSDAYGSLSGPVYSLPAGDVQAAVGWEYKTDSLFDKPDSVTAAGDGAVFSTPTNGGYSTGSGYVEMNIPILKDLPFVKSLTLDSSGRFDYNSTFGHALTHKEGLDWAINDDFRLRGNHSTGFRAPQVKELYGGKFLSNPGGSDPCAAQGSNVGNAACRASLVAVGLPATFVPSQVTQLSQLAGGSPTLAPVNLAGLVGRRRLDADADPEPQCRGRLLYDPRA